MQLISYAIRFLPLSLALHLPRAQTPPSPTRSSWFLIRVQYPSVTHPDTPFHFFPLSPSPFPFSESLHLSPSFSRNVGFVLFLFCFYFSLSLIFSFFIIFFCPHFFALFVLYTFLFVSNPFRFCSPFYLTVHMLPELPPFSPYLSLRISYFVPRPFLHPRAPLLAPISHGSAEIQARKREEAGRWYWWHSETTQENRENRREQRRKKERRTSRENKARG